MAGFQPTYSTNDFNNGSLPSKKLVTGGFLAVKIRNFSSKTMMLTDTVSDGTDQPFPIDTINPWTLKHLILDEAPSFVYIQPVPNGPTQIINDPYFTNQRVDYGLDNIAQVYESDLSGGLKAIAGGNVDSNVTNTIVNTNFLSYVGSNQVTATNVAAGGTINVTSPEGELGVYDGFVIIFASQNQYDWYYNNNSIEDNIVTANGSVQVNPIISSIPINASCGVNPGVLQVMFSEGYVWNQIQTYLKNNTGGTIASDTLTIYYYGIKSLAVPALNNGLKAQGSLASASNTLTLTPYAIHHIRLSVINTGASSVDATDYLTLTISTSVGAIENYSLPLSAYGTLLGAGEALPLIALDFEPGLYATLVEVLYQSSTYPTTLQVTLNID